jgi:hypothetical protein
MDYIIIGYCPSVTAQANSIGSAVHALRHHSRVRPAARAYRDRCRSRYRIAAARDVVVRTEDNGKIWVRFMDPDAALKLVDKPGVKRSPRAKEVRAKLLRVRVSLKGYIFAGHGCPQFQVI